MKQYFKEYTLTPEQILTAKNRARERSKSNGILNLGERLNKTNKTGYGGDECLHGYIGEEIIFQIDDRVTPADDFVGKYDYSRNGKYIDLKTMKTGSDMKTIIRNRYSTYLLHDQVMGSIKFCDQNGIEYKDYQYEIGYWNGSGDKFIRATHDNLILENIIQNFKPVIGKPPRTSGTDEELLQFVIPMADSEVTIL